MNTTAHADTVTIYHNPQCGTSRKVLGMLHAAGLQPHVVEYLKTPPDRATLQGLAEAMGEPVRHLLRAKEALATELGLHGAGVSDARLLDAMLEHPILINRPIVVAPGGTRLCRPAEEVCAIVPQATLPEGGAKA